MYHRIHSAFIETPLIDILKKGVQACSPLGVEDHSEPMKEYFLSSLFICMMVAQVKKLKCICWELATHDYSFRHDYLKNIRDSKRYGDFSSFSQKDNIYKALLRQLFLLNEGKRPSCRCLDKYGEFSQNTCREIKEQLKKEPLCYWLQKEIRDLEDTDIMENPDNGPYSPEDLPSSKKEWKECCLFRNDLQSIYSPLVEDHQDRCVYNLTSVQNHLPNLDQLKKPDYPQQNYVYRFVILILIDEIFIELYQKYKELVERSPWY